MLEREHLSSLIIFFLTLTKHQNERKVAEIIFVFVSGHKMKSTVHYVNRSGVLWHSVWEYHQFKIYKLQKLHSALRIPFPLNMFRKLDVELVQFYDCFLCQIILWWKKKKTMTYYFSLSQRKVFSFIPFFLWKNFQLYIFTNSCIFHKENVVVIIMFDVSVLHFSLFSVNLI